MFSWFNKKNNASASKINPKALERIKRAAAENATFLDLSNLNLTEIPKEIQEVKSLQNLDLSFNQITKIENLKGLLLQNLDLSFNQISKIENLEGLPLQVLSLWNNKISRIENLEGLPLQELDLGINQISRIENLEGLPLQVLYLEGNQISTIENLAGLPLQELNLRNNQISKIENLKGLPLQVLWLSYNQISKIENLEGLPLQGLYLQSNQISRIENLKGLPLQKLNLRFNQISKIENLAGLPLKELNLWGNQISRIEPILNQTPKNLVIFLKDWVIEDKNIIYIQNNPIEDCPQEILAQGRKAIEKYFEDIKEYGEEKLFEVKIEIIGEAGSGKTTTWRTLQNEDFEVPCTEQPSTVGMIIKENVVFAKAYQGEKDVKGHLWDFGGQEEQYQTHQFFLNPQSVFLLLHDDRAQKTNFRYWLNIIKVLGYDTYQKIYSPVLVILNKKENKGNTNFDKMLWQQHFKELNIEVIEVDFKDKTAGNIAGLKKRVAEITGAMLHLNQDFPANWIKIRKAIEIEKEKGRYFIEWREFKGVCAENGVKKHEDQVNLALLFHNLGILIYYKDNGVLEDIVILDANWAADAVYAVLKDKTIKENKGLFTKNQVAQIWNGMLTEAGEPKYSVEVHKRMLELMLKDNFEVAYPTLTKDEYIIPYLLSSVEPEYEFETANNLQLRLDFRFLPNGFMTRFMVRMHQSIKKEGEKSLVWKNGIYIESNGCTARVIEFTNMDEAQTSEKQLATIDISINGTPANRKYLLHQIRQEFRIIADNHFNKMEYEELIPCNCVVCSKSDKPYYYERSVLERRLNKNKKETECKKSDDDILILPLLEGILYKNEIHSKEEDSNKNEGKKHIAFFAANPHETARLRLQKEVQKVEDIFEKNKTYKIKARHDVTWTQVGQIITENNSSILHFCGHSTAKELIFTDDFDSEAEVTIAMFENFAKANKQLELIVLNSCYSSAFAERLSKRNIYVIATKNEVPDTVSVAFSQGFYQRLATGGTIEEAFLQGISQNNACKAIYGLWYRGEEVSTPL